MRDDASLAADPETHPHLLQFLAETHPEQTLANASMLLLPFEDLALARDIMGTARGAIASRNLEATALGCGPRALALFAVEVARRALPRCDWPRPGKARWCLDQAENFIFSERLSSFGERQRVDRGDLEREAGLILSRVRSLPLVLAPAAWCIHAALEAALAGRLWKTKLHAIDAAERSIIAIAGHDELDAALEREAQCSLLSSLLEEHGGR